MECLLTILLSIFLTLQVQSLMPVTHVIDHAEMPIEECKRRIVLNGDSVAYSNISGYDDEFPPEVRMYYYVLAACKYPHLKHTCSIAESFFLDLMYGNISKSPLVDKKSKQVSLLLLNAGINRKDWLAAYFMSFFYTYVEPDSVKAMDSYSLSLDSTFRGHSYERDTYNRRTKSFGNYWQNHHTRTFTTYSPIVFECDSASDVKALRRCIQCCGDTAAYNKLIKNSLADDQPYAFNECLFEAMLMSCKYNYTPANEHIINILFSFYTKDESPDSLTIQLMEIFEEP